MKAPISQSPQSGFTLIELMVAIAIFAFGMLALLSLITNSLVMTNAANYSSIASAQAYAIADSIRGNTSKIQSYDDPTIQSIQANCLTTAGCIANDMVNANYVMWKNRLNEALPNGQGIVCRDASPTDGDPTNWACDDSTTNPPYAVKICWNSNGVSTGAWQCYRTVI